MSSAARAVVVLLASLPQRALPQAPTGTAKFGEQTFSFPAEYTLDRVAGPPLVDRPIEASFDDRGRLYVTESSGTNDPAEAQRESKPHRVLRLTDRDGDGIYDERTVFAEGLMFPEGCLWKDGALYVAAVPEIWKFTDGKPIDNNIKTIKEIQATTSLSDEISKDLKKRGFKFIGSTVVYAHMQATGMVNDHVEDCWKRK